LLAKDHGRVGRADAGRVDRGAQDEDDAERPTLQQRAAPRTQAEDLETGEQRANQCAEGRAVQQRCGLRSRPGEGKGKAEPGRDQPDPSDYSQSPLRSLQHVPSPRSWAIAQSSLV